MNYIVSVERTNGRPTRVVCGDGGIRVVFRQNKFGIARVSGASYLGDGISQLSEIALKGMRRQASAILRNKPAMRVRCNQLNLGLVNFK